MTLIDLSPVKELYHLWKPVYPYLIRQIKEIYGRTGGDILEVGPFCGAIFTLQAEGISDSCLIATFPAGMRDFFSEEAERNKAGKPVRVVESNTSLSGIKDNSIDLAIFRGALFFPGFFQIDFEAIFRVLNKNGVALIGGGFGKYTPPEVIKSIAQRSKELNLLAGKIDVPEDEIRKKVGAGSFSGITEIVSEGGLWVIMRK